MQVAFYKGTRPGLAGLFNRLVRWWTRGPYSHCEVVFTDEPSKDGGVLCGSSSKLDGGVRLKSVVLDPARWDIVEVSGDVTAAKNWFAFHVGCKYDLRGLLGFVWRRAEDDRRKYFCSEAVASALGYDETWRFDPNTLAAMLRRNEGAV